MLPPVPTVLVLVLVLLVSDSDSLSGGRLPSDNKETDDAALIYQLR